MPLTSIKNLPHNMVKWLVLVIFLPVNVFAQQRFSFTQPKMGSLFTIVFYDHDSLHANKLAVESFLLVDSLNNIYSDYLPSSELNQLCATAGKSQWVGVSPALYDILIQSQRAWKLSERSFDITVGPVVRLWRKARKENKFPDADSTALALERIGFQWLLIDTVSRKVQLLKPGMQLDLGGIGQGYIGQKVLDYLKRNHIQSALVDVSGDIIASDPPPGRDGWVIAVNVPGSSDEFLDKKVSVRNAAIITSGDVYQYMSYGGKKYSHIVDPRTGLGVTNRRNVTVVAADGTTADWLTKAFTILPMRKVKRLAIKMKVDFLIGSIQKNKLRFHQSRGFKQYWLNERTGY